MGAIPTNLITGFLGVGKTTAVLDVLKRKSADEQWAVLVNEYGSISIDDAFIEGETVESGVSVRSVAGGCFCCVSAPMLPVALHFLLQEVTPDRLLIETSGLGHPAKLVDNIRQNYQDRLDVRSTLGIIAPADFTAPGMFENPVFRDQVEMSDVLILNKADRATPEVIQDFQRWANGLYPPKLLIAATEHGQLDPAWLDLSSADERIAKFPHWHDDMPQSPVQPTHGWIFPNEVIFALKPLLQFLEKAPQVTRLKGIFHTEQDWVAVNRVGAELTRKNTAYRRDSRLEVFGTQAMNWGEFEVALRQHIVPG